MKVAIIGAGWAARRHLGVLTAEPDIEIVGYVSPHGTPLQAGGMRWDGPCYPEIHALLEHEKVDAAWVCVPPGDHGTIEYALLDRQIPFFVEKPLSADRRTGEEIMEAIARKNVIAGVAYHWRAMDTLPAVRQKLAENPARMVQGFWHDSTPPPMWWRHQRTSGGQMVEQATHVIDLSRALLGNATVRSAAAARHPRPAYPTADVADVSAALLDFADDTVGVFSATCLLGGSASVHVQLICEGLLITITQAGVVYDYGKEKHEFKVRSDPFVVEDRAFIQAVRQNDAAPLYSSYDDAVQTHRLCHDILEASNKKPGQ
jgi:predicted dehydrogenase